MSVLPILPTEHLLISIRDPGKLLFPLFLLLLLLLGQRPLEVLDHSVLLLLGPVTLTLLLEKQKRDYYCFSLQVRDERPSKSSHWLIVWLTVEPSCWPWAGRRSRSSGQSVPLCRLCSSSAEQREASRPGPAGALLTHTDTPVHLRANCFHELKWPKYRHQ